MKDSSNHFKPIQISDSVIVEECEKKFQDYFIKQSKEGCKKSIWQKICKVFSQDRPILQQAEMSLNRELVELHQEGIIEKEEFVAQYPRGEDKYEKEQEIRRNTNQNKVILSVLYAQKTNTLVYASFPKSLPGNWFKPGKIVKVLYV